MGLTDLFKKKNNDGADGEQPNKRSSGTHYLTGKEVREIAKANQQEMRRLEKEKERKVPPSAYTTELKDPDNILEVENLHSYFFTDQGVVKAVNGVSFNIPLNSTVGVVGESGCGKSVTSMSIMRLLQGPSGQIVEGSIRFKAIDYMRDKNGKFVPEYETDENGEPVYEKVLDKKGNVKLDAHSTVGVVGESGCGKSVTSMSIMRLLQGPSGQIVEGSIRFKAIDYMRDKNGKFVPEYETDENGEPVYEKVLDKKGNVKLDAHGVALKRPKQKIDENGLKIYKKEEVVYDIAKMPIHEMYRLRGRQMSMVFQEPMTSLNPVFTIGEQLDEVTLLHVPDATKQFAKDRSVKMLNMVGIAMAERVYASYPHELSGGMRQRVMIAMALAGEPRLIIADEPTTALDVTIQAQILELFNDLKKRINGSILLITHDLGVIAEMADYVVVMYAGRIIEQGTASEIFHHPCHPYTQGLQKSKPTMKSKDARLFNIPGNVPNPVDMPDYCYFKERCDQCVKKCSGKYPGMVQVSPTHYVACHLYDSKED